MTNTLIPQERKLIEFVDSSDTQAKVFYDKTDEQIKHLLYTDPNVERIHHYNYGPEVAAIEMVPLAQFIRSIVVPEIVKNYKIEGPEKYTFIPRPTSDTEQPIYKDFPTVGLLIIWDTYMVPNSFVYATKKS